MFKSDSAHRCNMAFASRWFALLFGALLLGCFGTTANVAVAQLPDRPQRELFVPFEEIDVLLGSDARRVYLTRAEYDELLAKSKLVPGNRPPTKVALLSANYQAEVGEGRATIRGDLQLEVLDGGVQILPLTLAGVGVRSAKLDDLPASLVKNEDNQTWLVVDGIGKHRLSLDFVIPVATDAAQQTLQFQIPKAPTGELEFVVPGNIEIKSGAFITSREVNSESDTTTFKVLPSAAPISMVMSLNNRKLRDQSTVVARGVVIAEVTQAFERLHAKMSMGVLNGTVDEFRFAIDDDLEVNSVSSELLSKWSIDKVDGQQQLVVSLRTPATEREVINIVLDRTTRKLESWRLPKFNPLGVAGYSSVVGLLAEERLSVSAIEAESLISIDSKLLVAALPASLLAVEPGAPKLNTVAAFYAAQAQYSLTSQLTVKSARVVVGADALVTVSDRGLEFDGVFNLLPQNEKLFFFEFECPQNCTIDWVKSGTQNLKFDRFPASSEQPGVARIRVALPSGIAAGGQSVVTFHALQLPTNWLTKWDSQSLVLPNFRVLNAESQSGGIAVQLKDDLQATPETTQGLLVMNADEKARFQFANAESSLNYRFENADWSASFKVNRMDPRTIALVQSFVQLTTDTLTSHYEITFDVQRSRVQSLQFSLPESTPSEVSVRGLANTVVKETSNILADGRRVWTVQLAERKSGSVRLAVDFTQPLNTESSVELKLPIARAQGVAYQSGTLAVEGHPELEIEMVQNPRSVDIGELVDAEYQVGKRLIGVYGYVGEADNAVCKITRRPVHRLPTTIIERAELVTLVATHGVCQTAARFRMKTKAGYIEVQLPESASLWSALLDGKPALPQREDGRVLIAIPANNLSTLHNLQLVYESTSERILLRGELDVIAPMLSEREDTQTEKLVIPIADVKWDLILPHGYQVAWTGGNLKPLVTNSNEFSLSGILRRLRELGGGGDVVLASAVLQRRIDRTIDESVSDWDAKTVSPSEDAPSQIPPTAMMDHFSLNAPARPSSPAEVASVEPQTQFFDAQAGLSEGGQKEQTRVPSNLSIGQLDDFGRPAKPTADAKKKIWAMEGVRSLEIAVENNTLNETYSLTSLGIAPTASITIVHQARLDWIAIAGGVIVFVIGLVVVAPRRYARARYFFAVSMIALLAPPVTGYAVELEPVSLAMLAGLLALAVVLLLRNFLSRVAAYLVRDSARSMNTNARQSAVTTLMFFVVLNCSMQAVVMAQEQPPGQIVTDQAELAQLLKSLDDGGKVTLPSDAIIVPFDATKPDGLEAADKLLVPYDKYVELWNLANPEKPLDDPALPVKFAWSAANYSVTLDAKDSLQMKGSIVIELFTDNEVSIPLRLAGCVIEQAELDGYPARLQMLATQSGQQGAQTQDVQLQNQPVPPGTLYVLYLQGKGRKELTLQLRWQLDKRSGWRAIDGTLPATPASELTVKVPKTKTEVRLANGLDRSNFETSKENETIVTTLATDGRLSLNWRDKISEAAIDQGLTVQARSVFDIQENALKLAWHGEFEFRRGRRESFTLVVPKDYIVEKVVGDNIRGWTTKTTDSAPQLDIELLKAVTDRESLVVFISKQNAVDPQSTTQVTIPQITVPSAMLHQGHVAIRRSLLLDVRAEETTGLTRMEAVDETSWMAGHEIVGILPIKVYQAYRYSQVPFDLRVAVSVIKPKVRAQSQSLLKISQLERSLETRLLITSNDRQLYRLQIALPLEWKVQAPEVPGNFQWSLSPAGNRQLLQIHLADGQMNEFPVIIRARLAGETQPNTPIAFPQIDVIGAQRQSGAIVVQADPAYDVRAENLQGCEPVLLESVKSWLADNQRTAARLAVRFETAEFSGQLQVTARTPVVNSYSVTNIKVTDRAIEETLFIEANIRSAGIREFVFQMPASLATSRIQAPYVQQKIILPVQDNAEMVRVQLLLQDAIMGQFRVVVENDRELTSGPHAAPLPIVETGTTDRRLVTLENAGRDELITARVESFETLDRSQLLQRFQADLLGGKSSQAYLAQEDAVAPLLTYETKSREALATVGARIGLAQTLLVVDEHGTYRATQEYRVENRTEPFLEIEMPDDSRMWTVQVAGEPVKPALGSAGATAGTSTNRIRIPLIKTAEGDLDYPVVIKYGGQIATPSLLRRVEFPLIHTLNINVELSQVRLRLPEAYDWFNFGGTLGRVQSESELQAGWLSYRTRQLTELSQLLGSSSIVSDYTRARALNNLSTLESAIQQQSEAFTQNSRQSQELGKQWVDNSAALQAAQQQALQASQNQPTEGRGNRALLNDLYGVQSNGRSYNALGELGQNFYMQVPVPYPESAGKVADEANAASQNEWFSQNKLENSKPAEIGSRIAAAQQNLPATSSPTSSDPTAPNQQLQTPQLQTPDVMAGKRLKSAPQDGEAKDSQADRYNKRLQAQRGRAEALGDQNYGSTAQSAGRQSGTAANGMQNSGGFGAGGMGGEARDKMDSNFRMQAPGFMPPQIAELPITESQSAESMPPSRLPEPQLPGAPPTAAQEAFMASLEVDLPVRGREFFFTTPRGEVELSGQAIATSVYQRLYAIVSVLAIGAACWLTYILSSKVVRSLWGASIVALALVCFGAFSLIQAFVPIYGGLAILAALMLIFSKLESQTATALD